MEAARQASSNEFDQIQQSQEKIRQIVSNLDYSLRSSYKPEGISQSDYEANLKRVTDEAQQAIDYERQNILRLQQSMDARDQAAAAQAIAQGVAPAPFISAAQLTAEVAAANAAAAAASKLAAEILQAQKVADEAAATQARLAQEAAAAAAKAATTQKAATDTATTTVQHTDSTSGTTSTANASTGKVIVKVATGETITGTGSVNAGGVITTVDPVTGVVTTQNTQTGVVTQTDAATGKTVTATQITGGPNTGGTFMFPDGKTVTVTKPITSTIEVDSGKIALYGLIGLLLLRGAVK